MTSTVFAAVASLLVVGVIIEMLRRRQLKEKYAALWLVVGILIAVTAAFPTLLTPLASAVGVTLPANLLFFAAICLLLAVAVHLSWELSRLEDHTRSLAEEVALLRHQVEASARGADRGHPRDAPAATALTLSSALE